MNKVIELLTDGMAGWAIGSLAHCLDDRAEPRLAIAAMERALSAVEAGCLEPYRASTRDLDRVPDRLREAIAGVRLWARLEDSDVYERRFVASGIQEAMDEIKMLCNEAEMELKHGPNSQDSSRLPSHIHITVGDLWSDLE